MDYFTSQDQLDFGKRRERTVIGIYLSRIAHAGDSAGQMPNVLHPDLVK